MVRHKESTLVRDPPKQVWALRIVFDMISLLYNFLRLITKWLDFFTQSRTSKSVHSWPLEDKSETKRETERLDENTNTHWQAAYRTRGSKSLNIGTRLWNDYKRLVVIYKVLFASPTRNIHINPRTFFMLPSIMSKHLLASRSHPWFSCRYGVLVLHLNPAMP